MSTTRVKGAHLSRQQARLWAFGPQHRAYRIQGSVLLQGPLHLAAWQGALADLVAQHEILQTVFACLPAMEVPLQILGRCAPVACPLINLERLSPSAQQRQVDEQMQQVDALPFDLEQGPLVRLWLLRQGSERHVFVLSLSALCADAATVPLLLDELSRRYTARVQGWPDVEEPLQYTAVTNWQEKMLTSESASAPLQFWRAIDLEPLTRLPLPFAPSTQNEKLTLADCFAPHKLSIPLNEQVAKQLDTLSQATALTPAAVLLSCWTVALWRLSQQTDWLIGVAADGRPYQELRQALGLYNRLLPLPLTCQPEEPFLQFARRVQQALQQAWQWQAYFTWPPAQAAATLDAPPPLFPVGFEYQEEPTCWQAAGLHLRLHQHHGCSEPFILKLHGGYQQGHLHLELHYDRQHISPWRAQRLVDVLACLLAGLVEQPRAPLCRLPLLSPSAQQQLLMQWRGPRQRQPLLSIAQVFEAQAQRLPQQPAALSAQEQLSYQQLNARANQLAWVLRARGVGPNVAVGICLERGVEMLVGVLAILKAGGAYVPLDAQSPAARLSSQLQQVQAPLLLSQQGLIQTLSDWPGEVLNLEALAAEVGQAPSTNLPASSQSQDLAYVIYTSGSTGMPKGVQITQGNLLNYLLGLNEVLGGEVGWQYATVSTLAADLGNTAIYGAWASGGCVQVVDYATLTSAQAWRHWMQAHPIDVLKIVPSHLAALLAEEEASQACLPRQALIVGGEAMSRSLQERLRELGGRCVLYNHYGPTETTVGVLVKRLGVLAERAGAAQEEAWGEPVPLGQPLSNSQVYVLDAWQQLVPPGVAGELYIGGAGVGLGYVQQEEQTAERFVPHGWSEQPGERLYRTGDAVRISEEGELEFVGRTDGQVKLRGYRIEVGEIEAELTRHEQVWQAVVVLRSQGSAGPQLVGYVVPRQPVAPSGQQLREWLARSLPGYMLPASFVFLKQLPLTANGKLDRRRLMALYVNEDSHISSTGDPSSCESKTLVKPRDMIEFQLLRMWEELLPVASISVVDNFFDLGGHSILAVRLMSRIFKQFGRDLALVTLFQYPTIADLAVILRQEIKAEHQSALVAIQTQGSRPPFFCVHPSGGTVFSYVSLGRYLGPDQPLYGLQTVGFSTVSDNLATVEDLAAHYIAAIQTIQPQGPYLLGGWSMGGVVAFEMAQQLRKQGHEIGLLAIIDSVIADNHMRARAIEEKIDFEDTEIVREIIHQFKIAVPDDFDQLNLEAQFDYVLEQTKKMHIIPVDIGIEQVRHVFLTGKLHAHIAHVYLPQGYPYRIDYFVASDPMNPTKSLEGPEHATNVSVRRDYLGPWREIADGGIEVNPIPGSHSTMMEEPNVQVLAASLNRCIDRVCKQLHEK